MCFSNRETHFFQMPRWVLILFSMMLVSSLARAETPPVDLDGLVKPFIQDKPYVGLVIGVMEKGKKEIKGYGKVVVSGKESVPDDATLFEIGSITKAFTGALFADLVISGKVRPDDPVNKFLPANLRVPTMDERELTLLHLATHTGGLPVQPPLLPFHALVTKNPSDPYAEFDLEKLQKTLEAFKPVRPFGSKFQYSNLGVGLLGHALAQANGSQNFEEALAQRILAPLGMKSTGLKVSPTKLEKLAPGYTKTGMKASGWTFATLEACGGLRSNAQDMMVFLEAAMGLGEKPLERTFRLAQLPWRETDRKDHFVGFCWMRQKSPGGGGTVVWHNGGTAGYRSFLGFIPESQVGVVILSNSANSVDALAISILQKLEQAKVAP